MYVKVIYAKILIILLPSFVLANFSFKTNSFNTEVEANSFGVLQQDVNPKIDPFLSVKDDARNVFTEKNLESSSNAINENKQNPYDGKNKIWRVNPKTHGEGRENKVAVSVFDKLPKDVSPLETSHHIEKIKEKSTSSHSKDSSLPSSLSSLDSLSQILKGNHISLKSPSLSESPKLPKLTGIPQILKFVPSVIKWSEHIPKNPKIFRSMKKKVSLDRKDETLKGGNQLEIKSTIEKHSGLDFTESPMENVNTVTVPASQNFTLTSSELSAKSANVENSTNEGLKIHIENFFRELAKKASTFKSLNKEKEIIVEGKEKITEHKPIVVPPDGEQLGMTVSKQIDEENSFLKKHEEKASTSKKPNEQKEIFNENEKITEHDPLEVHQDDEQRGMTIAKKIDEANSLFRKHLEKPSTSNKMNEQKEIIIEEKEKIIKHKPIIVLSDTEQLSMTMPIQTHEENSLFRKHEEKASTSNTPNEQKESVNENEKVIEHDPVEIHQVNEQSGMTVVKKIGEGNSLFRKHLGKPSTSNKMNEQKEIIIEKKEKTIEHKPIVVLSDTEQLGMTMPEQTHEKKPLFRKHEEKTSASNRPKEQKEIILEGEEKIIDYKPAIALADNERLDMMASKQIDIKNSRLKEQFEKTSASNISNEQEEIVIDGNESMIEYIPVLAIPDDEQFGMTVSTDKGNLPFPEKNGEKVQKKNSVQRSANEKDNLVEDKDIIVFLDDDAQVEKPSGDATRSRTIISDSIYDFVAFRKNSETNNNQVNNNYPNDKSETEILDNSTLDSLAKDKKILVKILKTEDAIGHIQTDSKFVGIPSYNKKSDLNYKSENELAIESEKDDSNTIQKLSERYPVEIIQRPFNSHKETMTIVDLSQENDLKKIVKVNNAAFSQNERKGFIRPFPVILWNIGFVPQ